MSALFPTIAADIQDGFGDTNYWTCDDYNVYFGNTLVAQNKETKKTLYKTADFEIDLVDLTGEETSDKFYVNGVETKIEKVNVGFMAVLAPEGDCEIRFVYNTPGLKTGCYISFGAIFVAAAYIIICFVLRRRNPAKWAVVYPEGEELHTRFEEYDKEDNLLVLEEQTDEIEEYYKSLNSHTSETSSNFSGGFTVDTTILDKNFPEDTSEE